MSNWKSAASIEALRKRAELLANIREFFAGRNILEVETPLLSRSAATDVYIQSMRVATAPDNLFLQTSPEFFMKRLLASGSGAIYQICKSFREGETSRVHNPEFTMLEWYRPDFSMTELMDEVEQLLVQLLGQRSIPRVSYRALFEEHIGIDPHQISEEQIPSVAAKHIEVVGDKLSKTDYLQLLMANSIEPSIEHDFFVYDFPVEQAALATIMPDDQQVAVAKRFELFSGGIELANGYYELIDAHEQRQRFESDLSRRKQLGLKSYPVDENLLAALEVGMPQCSGVALGVDRLLMQVLGANTLDQVLPFDFDRV